MATEINTDTAVVVTAATQCSEEGNGKALGWEGAVSAEGLALAAVADGPLLQRDQAALELPRGMGGPGGGKTAWYRYHGKESRVSKDFTCVLVGKNS